MILLLLVAVLSPPMAAAQRIQIPQPVFTELFAYDPAAPSQLLGKWLISSQLDSKLQPLHAAGQDFPAISKCDGGNSHRGGHRNPAEAAATETYLGGA